MDADLVAEIERLQKIHEERGLYDFLCECQDCWLASQALCRPSPLFALCSPDGKLRMRRDGQLIGCPFSIRRSDLYRSPLLFAWTDEWTAAIRSDDRIPLNEARMRPKSCGCSPSGNRRFVITSTPDGVSLSDAVACESHSSVRTQ